MNAHIFAIYYPNLPNTITLIVDDVHILQRIESILRLRTSDEIILFDDTYQVRATITSLTKKTLTLAIIERVRSSLPEPAIIWLMPLIDREQWEQALYSLAAIGITTIVPVTMAQSRVRFGAAKDYERARRIMIAACEQAKQFVIPELTMIQDFSQALNNYSSISQKIYFDAPGIPLRTMLESLKQESIICITGPEGGFSEQEIASLNKEKFVSCALTSSILKASHAVALGAGILRSWCRS